VSRNLLDAENRMRERCTVSSTLLEKKLSQTEISERAPLFRLSSVGIRPARLNADSFRLSPHLSTSGCFPLSTSARVHRPKCSTWFRMSSTCVWDFSFVHPYPPTVDAHLASYLRWSGFKFHFEATMPASRFSSLIRAIATDVHFWIPLSVLLGGLVLLDKLR